MFKGKIRELNNDDLNAVEGILGMYWFGELKDRFLKRIKDFVEQTPESLEQKYMYFVAEENGEVVGFAGMRKAPEHMKKYATTDNPAEFYISAAKYKGKGIGMALRSARIEEAKKLGFTEAIFFSPESHKDS